MRRFLFTCGLLFLSAPLAGADVPDLLGLTVTEYVSVIKRVLSNETPLFDQLTKTKASSAAGVIYSDSTDLQKVKLNLRNQIENQMITRVDLDKKIAELDEKVRHWANDINGFSNEIDKVPNVDTRSLRFRTLELSTHKLPGLDKVREAWRPDELASRMATMRQLDAAIIDLQEVLRASKCLSDSIDSRQLACDAKTLSPLSGQGKPSPE